MVTVETAAAKDAENVTKLFQISNTKVLDFLSNLFLLVFFSFTAKRFTVYIGLDIYPLTMRDIRELVFLSRNDSSSVSSSMEESIGGINSPKDTPIVTNSEVSGRRRDRL